MMDYFCHLYHSYVFIFFGITQTFIFLMFIVFNGIGMCLHVLLRLFLVVFDEVNDCTLKSVSWFFHLLVNISTECAVFWGTMSSWSLIFPVRTGRVVCRRKTQAHPRSQPTCGKLKCCFTRFVCLTSYQLPLFFSVIKQLYLLVTHMLQFSLYSFFCGVEVIKRRLEMNFYNLCEF